MLSGYPKSVVLVACLFLSMTSLSVHAAATPLRFGSVALESPLLMHKRLTPLANYLSRILERPVELVLSPNISTAINNLIHDQVDLAFLTPAAYVRTHQISQTVPLVKARIGDHATFRLAIISRANGPVKIVDDLKGRRFAFGDRRALLQRATLYSAGLKLEDFDQYDFLDHLDNVIRAVLHGAFDGGIVAETAARKWESRGLRIIYLSPELPSFNISASRRLDETTRARIKAALLRLDVRKPGDRAVIKSIDPEYTGFLPANDADYDIVRTLIRPYETDATSTTEKPPSPPGG